MNKIYPVIFSGLVIVAIFFLVDPLDSSKKSRSSGIELLEFSDRQSRGPRQPVRKSFEELVAERGPIEGFKAWEKLFGPNHPAYSKNLNSALSQLSSIQDGADLIAGLTNVEVRNIKLSALAGSWVRSGQTREALDFLSSIPPGSSQVSFVERLFRGGEISSLVDYLLENDKGDFLSQKAFESLLRRKDLVAAEGNVVVSDLFTLIERSKGSSHVKGWLLRKWLDVAVGETDLREYVPRVISIELESGGKIFEHLLTLVSARSPAKAVDLFNEFGGQLPEHKWSPLFEKVVSEFGRSDLKGCLSWVTQLEGETRLIAVDSVIKAALEGNDNPELVFDLALEAGLRENELVAARQRFERKQKQLVEAAQVDDANRAEIEWVKNQIQSDERDLGYAGFLGALGSRSDLQEAERNLAIARWVGLAQVHDAKAVAAVAMGNPDVLREGRVRLDLADRLAIVDGEFAMRWARDLEAQAYYDDLISRVGESWSRHDQKSFDAWVRSQPSSDFKDRLLLQIQQ